MKKMKKTISRLEPNGHGCQNEVTEGPTDGATEPILFPVGKINSEFLSNTAKKSL